MKKVICVLVGVCVALGALVGCGSEKESGNKIKSYTTEGKETKLVPDESTTGELTVEMFEFAVGAAKSNFIKATEIFCEMYPNVDLKVNHIDGMRDKIDYTEYSQQLATQIMAGKSADVISITSDMDVYKMTSSGAFADMHEYFENDNGFNINDYNKAVFYGSQHNGDQYVIPLRYSIPIFVSTNEILKQLDLKLSGNMDCFDTADSLIKTAKENKLSLSENKVFENMNMIYFYFPIYFGIEWIDFEKMTANLDIPEFERAIKTQKEMLNCFPRPESASFGARADIRKKMQDKETALYSFDYLSFADVLNSARDFDGNEVLFSFRNINKKITAVVSNSMAIVNSSKNKENAYRFIKIMLSNEVQGEYDVNSNSLINSFVPVSNTARNKIFSVYEKEEKLFNMTQGGVSSQIISSYTKLLDDIDSVYYENKAQHILQEKMQPYFEGEKSYDECIKNAQEQLEIYLSE